MSVTINIHAAPSSPGEPSIKASAKKWLTLDIADNFGCARHDITIFTQSAELSAALADAINGVMEKFGRPVETPAEPPILEAAE